MEVYANLCYMNSVDLILYYHIPFGNDQMIFSEYKTSTDILCVHYGELFWRWSKLYAYVIYASLWDKKYYFLVMNYLNHILWKVSHDWLHAYCTTFKCKHILFWLSDFCVILNSKCTTARGLKLNWHIDSKTGSPGYFVTVFSDISGPLFFLFISEIEGIQIEMLKILLCHTDLVEVRSLYFCP